MKHYFPWSCCAASMPAVAATLGYGASGPTLPDRIEEDRQVVIANPDPRSIGPQITTCANPSSDPAAAFVTFYLNYQDYPSWNPGGLQIRGTGPGSRRIAQPSLGARLGQQGSGVCETQGETVSWTQRMKLSVAISQLQRGQRAVNHLGPVRPWTRDVRCQHAQHAFRPECLQTRLFGLQVGVSWQSNRVTSMTSLGSDTTTGGQLISTDSTSRTVDLTPGN